MASTEMNEHEKALSLAQTNLFQAIKACPITTEKVKEQEDSSYDYNFKMQRESMLSNMSSVVKNSDSVAEGVENKNEEGIISSN